MVVFVSLLMKVISMPILRTEKIEGVWVRGGKKLFALHFSSVNILCLEKIASKQDGLSCSALSVCGEGYAGSCVL